MDKTMEQPIYTIGEERLNMISHIVGGGLGVVALVACVIVAAYHQNVLGIVGGIIYGCMVILLFTMSSIYHGLGIGLPKKVFRVLDHCTIYLLIAGTYTPILLSQFLRAEPATAWVMFGLIWGFAVLGVTLTAIDRKKFKYFALACYLGMGWMAIFRVNLLVYHLGAPFFIMILIGGILYTVGVAFYVGGKKKRYMHGVFHLFVNAASILHSVAIAIFIMPGGVLNV